MALALVSASLIIYFGQINQEVTVNQPVILTGTGCVGGVCTETIETMFSGDTLISNDYETKNIADTLRFIKLNSVCSATGENSCAEITTTPVFKLLTIAGTYFEEGVGDVSYQDRVTAKSTQTLDSINSILFDYKTSDVYIPYVVLGIDTDGDGVVNTNLVRSETAGPINQWNTLSVDDTWLTNQKASYPTAKVLQVKVMYGYWGGAYPEAIALVKNIKVNGVDIVNTNGLVLRERHESDPLDNQWGDVIVDFAMESYFPVGTIPATYTITTDIKPVA